MKSRRKFKFSRKIDGGVLFALILFLISSLSPRQALAAGGKDDDLSWSDEAELYMAVPAADGQSAVSIRQFTETFAEFTAPPGQHGSGRPVVSTVYRVDIESGGEIVYSNVFGAAIAEAGSVTIDVDAEVPEGAAVTVSLLYSGAAYQLGSGHDPVVSWVADGKPRTAEFALEYDGSNAVGYGLVNAFEVEPLGREPVSGDGFSLPDTGGVGVLGVLCAGGALAFVGVAGAWAVRRSRRRAALALLCAALALGSVAVPVSARGGPAARIGTGSHPVITSVETELVESVDGFVKHVSVSNTDMQHDVFVRARAFCPEGYSLAYSSESESWLTGDGGWWYYDDVLPAGRDTPELDIAICDADGGAVVAAGEARTFNVIVVYEATPVLYDEAGEPHPGW